MGDLTLVKMTAQKIELTYDQVAPHIDGTTDKDKESLRKALQWMCNLPAGQVFKITANRPRSNPFHSRHMLIESRIFDAQERIKNFEQFRVWLKVGAGFCDWLPYAKGGVFPVVKSIEFATLDELAYREVHADMMRFLRGDDAATFLWPLLSPKLAYDAMNNLLSEFGE